MGAGLDRALPSECRQLGGESQKACGCLGSHLGAGTAHALGKGGEGRERKFSRIKGLKGLVEAGEGKERERHSRPEGQGGQTSRGENEHPVCVRAAEDQGEGAMGALENLKTNLFTFLVRELKLEKGRDRLLGRVTL